MKVKSAEYLRSAVRPQDFLPDGRPQVVFVGRSNVGKSTLLNRLLGRNSLARISSKPGRTRAINYFEINSNCYFVDLPGYGYAKVSKKERQAWANLMAQYFETVGDSALIIQLVDAKVGVTPLDRQATDYFVDLGIEPVVVATKIDRVPKGKRAGAAKAIRHDLELPEATIIPFAAPSGDGSKEIWKEIDQYFDTFESRDTQQGVSHG